MSIRNVYFPKMRQALNNLRKWGFDTRALTNHVAYQWMARYGYEWKAGRWTQCAKYRRGLYKAKKLGRSYSSVTAKTLYAFLKSKGYECIDDRWRKKIVPVVVQRRSTNPVAAPVPVASKPKQAEPPDFDQMSPDDVRDWIMSNPSKISARKR